MFTRARNEMSAERDGVRIDNFIQYDYKLI
jgi:hypothetical protein